MPRFLCWGWTTCDEGRYLIFFFGVPLLLNGHAETLCFDPFERRCCESVKQVWAPERETTNQVSEHALDALAWAF